MDDTEEITKLRRRSEVLVAFGRLIRASRIEVTEDVVAYPLAGTLLLALEATGCPLEAHDKEYLRAWIRAVVRTTKTPEAPHETSQ
jgi:hypothetical protein